MSSSIGTSCSLQSRKKHAGCCSMRMARPKSMSLMCHLEVLAGLESNKMFSALTSRCTMDCSCKCRKACNSWRPTAATQPSLTATLGSASAAKSSPPETHSMTRKSQRSFSKTSISSTICGWRTEVRILASCRAEMNEEACAYTGPLVSTTLTAYFLLLSTSLIGQQSLTWPKEPLPRSPPISYTSKMLDLGSSIPMRCHLDESAHPTAALNGAAPI
mmetsp:Transcript_117782/g.328070  ORF Transcript_117782/g.328070 Transcript_117782/m.328070 type:complete len:217 (+) Transcript_117782:985-1635(+)